MSRLIRLWQEILQKFCGKFDIVVSAKNSLSYFLVADNLNGAANNSFDVSIILPALKSNNDLLRCIYSIRAAFKEQLQYEIIVVVPDLDGFVELTGADIKIVPQQQSGIYAAMNVGVNSAKGNYLYFIGQDDILLGGAAKAIKQGMAEASDLILANVFWGGGGVFKNSTSRSSLVWRNWCHQGIFYKRERFVEEIKSFPTQFTAQADHYVNIVFSGLLGFRITKYNGCIAWYSGDGFSAKQPDMVFRKSFPAIVYKHFGVLSYLMVISRRKMLGALNFLLKK
jgi:glycosyltransferase involved in cell wall biosynthesis